MQRRKFIVIDGMDGSGKGTQLALLREALKDYPVYYTREPGGNGSDTAEFIRTVILKPESFNIAPVPLCDLFLFWASRAQHIEEVVEPKRAAGFHVLSDRYDSSTVAFQLYGEQKDFLTLFGSIRRAMPPTYWPDAYIILDLPAEVAYERRAKDAGQDKTRFDLKPIGYHARVRAGFRFFKDLVVDPNTVHLIDANRSPEAVHAEVTALVRSILDA